MHFSNVQTLSRPARRKLNHTRSYTACGYEREDGLFDIEVEMTDVKPYSFDNQDRGHVAANEPLHHMQMRATIDDRMKIVDMEAVTLAGPYNLCNDITQNYKRLIGVRIAPGFTNACKKATGGVEGCTHHNDILRILGTVAFQSMWPVLNQRLKDQQAEAAKKAAAEGADLSDVSKKVSPYLLNSCHAYAPTSPVVQRQWPDHYKPKQND